VSGNPKGRPKGVRYISEALRFDREARDEDGRTNADKLSAVIWRMALSGDLKAIELILSRIEGPPPQVSVSALLEVSLQRLKGEASFYERMRTKQIDYSEAVDQMVNEAVEAGVIVLPEEDEGEAVIN
jgi:hypothetical protein